MSTLFSQPKIRRIAPTLLPLLAGILIGSVWTAGPPAAVTAQPPADPRANASPFPVGGQDGFSEAVESGKVTVIESRGGRDVAGSGDLIGFSHVDEAGTQVITIVDAAKRWMAVYHVGSEGKIRLVSSREIAADFTLELNATPPLPDQIRRLQGLPPRSP